MSSHGIIATGLSLLLVLSGAASCASTPDTDDDVDTLAFGSEADVVEVYEAAARWLPQESSVVAVVSDPSAWYLLDELLLPTSNPDAEPGSPGTSEGLHADLEKLFVEFLGFDPTNTDAAALGAGLGGGTLVLFGEYGEIQGLEEVERAGAAAFKVDLQGETYDEYRDMEGIDEWEAMGNSIGTDSLYIMPIDAPRRGLVMTRDQADLDRLDGGDGVGQAMLDSGERAAMFSRLIAEARGTSFAVASPIGELSLLMGENADSVPEAVVFSYGDAIGLTLEGDDAALAEMAQGVEDWITDLQATMTERYEQQDGDFYDRFSAIYGYHGIESVAGQLEPKIGDRTLRYEVVIGEMDWTSVTMLMSALIGGLWDTLDPFDSFMDPGGNWGPDEAESTIREISSAAATHFEDEQLNCGGVSECLHPWHDTGQEAWAPVAFEDKVFPGGTEFKITTMDEIPVEGEVRAPNPRMGAGVDVDFALDIVTAALWMDVDAPTDVRYIYETGPKTGTEATATITAEMITDEDTGERYQVRQTLEVGDDGQVNFSDPIVDEGRIEDDEIVEADESDE